MDLRGSDSRILSHAGSSALFQKTAKFSEWRYGRSLTGCRPRARGMFVRTTFCIRAMRPADWFVRSNLMSLRTSQRHSLNFALRPRPATPGDASSGSGTVALITAPSTQGAPFREPDLGRAFPGFYFCRSGQGQDARSHLFILRCNVKRRQDWCPNRPRNRLFGLAMRLACTRTPVLTNIQHRIFKEPSANPAWPERYFNC